MGQNWPDFDENEAPGIFSKTPRSGIGFAPPGFQNHVVLYDKLKFPEKKIAFVEEGFPSIFWHIIWGGCPPLFFGTFFGGAAHRSKKMEFGYMPLSVFWGGDPAPDTTEEPLGGRVSE